MTNFITLGEFAEHKFGTFFAVLGKTLFVKRAVVGVEVFIHIIYRKNYSSGMVAR